MDTAENKQLLQRIFRDLANGDSGLLIDSMADDFCWTVTGTTRWSGTYTGKQAVLTDLFASLRDRIADRIRLVAHRFIAEDDYVVVEARGNNVTRSDVAYNNVYCMVFRVAGGKLKEVTEYMDTELVAAALGARNSA